MKHFVFLALVAAMAFGSLSTARADHGCAHCNSCGGGLFGGGLRLGRLGHGCGHCGHHGCRHHYIEGRDRFFNCGCNGSYNYPVPPLYTYHWPGMYKQVRMTDYVSPWRFPPLRPYTEEVLEPLLEDVPPPAVGVGTTTPITHLQPIVEQSLPADYQPSVGEIEPLSSKMERLLSR